MALSPATALEKLAKVRHGYHAEAGQRVAAVTLRASSWDPIGLGLYCRCRGVPVHNPGTDDVMRLPLVMLWTKQD